MLRSVALMALVAATSVWAADEPECSLDKKCPESAPCCGQYHQCGTGAFCLGGCDPRMSFSLESCVPEPVCEDRKLKLNTLDNIQDISEYLGDSTKADWVASGEPAVANGNVILTMARQTVGTVLSSTVYMWYGRVKARMRTSRGRGVVTAFILFSDVKDEIDYEFVGVDLETAQTNYYYQGITNYENSANISLSDTFSNWHEYEINWTPDKIEWIVDGQVGRTKLRKDTWNSTEQRWDFPQTPARVQLSLWPGGLETNGQGTIDWAGGTMDWDHEDIKKAGYFYAMASDVTIECWKGEGRLGSNDGVSYTYSNTKATNDTVEIGDRKTTIASLTATGDNPDKGKKEEDKDDDKDKDEDTDKDKDSKDDKDKDDEDDTPPSVPGGGAAGNKDQEEVKTTPGGNSGSSGGSSGSGDSGSSGSDSTQPADGSSGCGATDFHSSCGGSSSNSNNNGDGGSGSSKASASALAIVIAGCALYWL